MIDPIDGTKSYVRGMDTWTTLIALLEDGEVKLGVVSMPALSKRWWAVRGQGAFADGRRIHVSNIAEPAAPSSLWSGIEEWDAIGGFEKVVELGRRCWRTRGVGDAWQYMLVAEGAAEIATDPEATLWDLAAVSIVVEEAGGRFTSLAGVDWARMPAAASRPTAGCTPRRSPRLAYALTRSLHEHFAHAPDSMLSGGPGPPLSSVGVSRASARCA